MRLVGRVLHLSRRFVGALGSYEPKTEDEAWAASVLVGGSGSHALWRRMPAPDRRHAVGVARRVEASLGPMLATTSVIAAALLHDVGKIESGLGTFGRVPATIAGLVSDRRRTADWATLPPGPRRNVGLYLSHGAIGAELLRDAQADALVVAWAAEHHLPRDQWTVPTALGDALKAADDD